LLEALYPKGYILKIRLDSASDNDAVAFFFSIGFDFLKIHTEEGNFLIVLRTSKNHELLVQFKELGGFDILKMDTEISETLLRLKKDLENVNQNEHKKVSYLSSFYELVYVVAKVVLGTAGIPFIWDFVRNSAKSHISSIKFFQSKASY
jgi:hypothetical protein